MSDAARNGDVVRRLMCKVWGQGRMDLLPELIAVDYVGHLPIGDHYGPEGVRIDIAAYRAAIPDLTVSLDDLFALDDRVVRRFTLRGTQGAPPLGRGASGRPLRLPGIGVDRLAGGKLVESWVIIAGFDPDWSG